jgi:RNA polymerase-binding transcription factor DksA
MELYPLDYQLSLGRTIRERITLLRKKGALEDASQMQDALGRLHRSDFGQCVSCGSVIPYLDIAADPASRHCGACLTRDRR